MPITYFPLNVDVSQVVGTPVKRARIEVKTNLPEKTVLAYGAAGQIAVPGGVYDLADGIGSLTLPTKTGATNVSDWQYVVTGEYSLDGVRPVKMDPIYIDAPTSTDAVNLASFIGVTSAPATFMGQAVAQLQAKVDEAEAIKQYVNDVSNIDTTVSAVDFALGQPGPAATLNAAIADKAPPRRLASATRPTLAYGVTVQSGTSGPAPVDYFGGHLYGTVGTSLRRSSDDGATWSTLGTLPFEPIRLLPTADGEVLAIAASNMVWKSSGWAAGPGVATWATKVTAYGSSLFYRFSIDGDGTKFIASEYTSTRADSRYVHISTDAGSTWTTVWDTNAQYPGTAAESHVHGCCYDPWEDRFWFTEGHGAPKGFYYSDNDGASWTKLTGGYADSLVAMPIALVATDDGIVLGTDDAPNGIMGIRRADPAALAVEVVWERFEARNGAYGLAERGFRDPETGLVYFSYRSEYATNVAYIAAGNASSGGLVWDAGVAGAGNRVSNVVVTPSGRLVASYVEGVTNYLVRGWVGNAGAPRQNQGNTEGARAAHGASVASGLGAEALGLQSTAFGPGAKAASDSGTAVGALSLASGNSTAVGRGALASGSDKMTALGALSQATGARSTAAGYDAQATAADATAVGDETRANASNATAIGSLANAQGNGTATGRAASTTGADAAAFGMAATAAVQAVAFGHNASAVGAGGAALGRGASVPTGHTASVALGFATTTTAAQQVNVGAKHFELTESAAVPGTPAADRVRLYAIDVAGKTALVVKFADGTAQQIAIQP